MAKHRGSSWDGYAPLNGSPVLRPAGAGSPSANQNDSLRISLRRRPTLRGLCRIRIADYMSVVTCLARLNLRDYGVRGYDTADAILTIDVPNERCAELFAAIRSAAGLSLEQLSWHNASVQVGDTNVTIVVAKSAVRSAYVYAIKDLHTVIGTAPDIRSAMSQALKLAWRSQ